MAPSVISENLFLKALVGLCLCFGTLVASQTVSAPNSASKPARLWQSSPGAAWNDCFLIGNGRLGASIPGGAKNDSIWLNEETFWNGMYKSRINPKALASMPNIRSAVVSGSFSTAQSLATSNYDGVPSSARNYNTLGSMVIMMNHAATVQGYERWLDVSDATSGVYYTVDGVTYTREYVASKPADAIAIRIAASKPGSVSFSVSLKRGGATGKASGSDTVVLTTDSGGDLPIRFASGARVVPVGGTVSASGSQVTCAGADEAWIFVTAWTTVRQSDPLSKVTKDLQAITKKYPDLRADHVKDYQSIYQRADFNFGTSTSSQKALTTAQRISGISQVYDPELVVLSLQFARYLLISSSRRGTLPANLQGIWNSEENPMWGSRFTININLQMNYWHAFVTNLIEDVSEPFFELIHKVNWNGKDTAKKMFNARGSCAHHNTDLWGDTAPQDNWQPGTAWTQGLAWLVMHTYEHYLYTGDLDFLKANFGPIKDSAAFFLDFLTDYKGWKVTNPTTSPENTFISNGGRYSVTCGSTIDNTLIRTLFRIVLEFQSLLNATDTGLVAEIQKLLPKLPPLRQNKWGGVMEWIEDYDEAEPGMSHMSQLLGAYPLADITPSNQTTFNWAVSSLNRRLNNGGGSIGWPRAWVMAMAARFFQPDLVSQGVVYQLQKAYRPSSMMNVGAPAQFQIDANFGSAAGMAEALLQSHEWLAADSTATSLRSASYDDAGRITLIRLLPALPKTWAANGGGFARGLRARGGFQVDLVWNSSGSLQSANITSLNGSPAWVTLGGNLIGSAGKSVKVSGGSSGPFVKISGAKGSVFTIILA